MNWLRDVALVVGLFFLHYLLVVWIIVGDPDKGQWYVDHGNLWYAISAVFILACVALLVNVIRLQHMQHNKLRNWLKLPELVVICLIVGELLHYFIFSRSWYGKISTYVVLVILMSWGIEWFRWYRKQRNKQEEEAE